MTTSTHYASHRSWLIPLRHYIDTIAINDTQKAKIVCKLIPPSCPFEREIQLFGHRILQIPPLCHFNPVYEELIALRFRALMFLSDQ